MLRSKRGLLMRVLINLLKEFAIFLTLSVVTLFILTVAYYSLFMVNKAFGANKLQKRKIAVIDTGIKENSPLKKFMCLDGHKDFTGTGLDDAHGHGTNIAGIIARNIDPSRECIVVLKFYDPFNTQSSSENFNLALKEAVDQKVSFVNFSGGGQGSSEIELSLIEQLLKNGTVVVVAAGNDGKNLTEDCFYFPACYKVNNKNFHVVENVNNGIRVPSSNWGGPVTDKENGYQQDVEGIVMTGTSQAAAVATSKLIRQYYLPHYSAPSHSR